MPKQKDLKRIVRGRMEKTGESYTAARLQVLKKKSEPEVDLAALAGMSDAAVSRQTGHTWKQWVETLDAGGAAGSSHREITRLVSSFGTPSWWTQMVAVGYERIRGLRDKRQKRGGLYEAGKSRTFAVPVEKLYRAVATPRARARWLPGVKLKVRTANPNKMLRITWDDDTRVEIAFVAKGASKSLVAVSHQRLTDRAAVEKMKIFWSERLGALSEILFK